MQALILFRNEDWLQNLDSKMRKNFIENEETAKVSLKKLRGTCKCCRKFQNFSHKLKDVIKAKNL